PPSAISLVSFVAATPPTALYPLSLHDALPISTTVDRAMRQGSVRPCVFAFINGARGLYANHCDGGPRWEDAVHGDVRSYLLTVLDRKSTRLNSSHVKISYAVFCLKKKNKI